MWSKNDVAGALLLGALGVLMTLVLARSAAGATPVPPRVQLAQRIAAHDGPEARAAGARVTSVTCRIVGPEAPHVYLCAERWTSRSGLKTCAEDAFHYLHGQIVPGATAWACGARPLKIPPFPGDPPASSGPTA